MAHAPQKPKPPSAEALKTEACLLIIVKFVDGNSRVFYSGDVRFKGKWQYKNFAYWLEYWKHRIEKESPEGWEGRVAEGAIFHNQNGQRGQKVLQYDKSKGWQ